MCFRERLLATPRRSGPVAGRRHHALGAEEDGHLSVFVFDVDSVAPEGAKTAAGPAAAAGDYFHCFGIGKGISFVAFRKRRFERAHQFGFGLHLRRAGGLPLAAQSGAGAHGRGHYWR